MSDQIDKELARVKLVKPSDITKVIEDAVNPDTDRMTRSMKEQMTKIQEGIEKDIRDTEGVLQIIQDRLDNLNTALRTVHACVGMLE